jgi:hypothetical protein
VIRSFSGRHVAVGAEGLLLYGVIGGDATIPTRPFGVDAVPLRDVIALVRRVPYARIDADSAAIAEYRRVIEAAFRDHSVLPVPFGTVFRNRDALTRWMEIHYVSLLEGLGFVQNRASARVRVAMAEPAADAAAFETTVFDSLRFLNRHAVACLTMTPEPDPRGRPVADASFLVERAHWDDFSDAVREEQDRLPNVSIEQTGPWPAYDFVRLQFGA